MTESKRKRTPKLLSEDPKPEEDSDTAGEDSDGTYDEYTEDPPASFRRSNTEDEEVGPPRKKPGRKPAPDHTATKRLIQIRTAQRAYRKRKEDYAKGLEQRVAELTKVIERQERNQRTSDQDVQREDELRRLRSRVEELEQENGLLRQLCFPSVECSSIPIPSPAEELVLPPSPDLFAQSLLPLF